MGRLQEMKNQRLERLAKLKDLGVNPFAFNFKKEKTIRESCSGLGKNTQTAGRIMAIRGHGALVFADLLDETGKIQLIIHQENLTSKENQLVSLTDIGDFIGVSGKVIESKTGEISIDVNKFTLLTKSLRPLPSRWHGLKDIEERYRKRYLDLLLNPNVRKVFDTRTKLLSFFRKYLDEHGFSEVETPVLQPIYGGATAKPFTTFHNALKSSFYLRIADELYLKRLIIGGYEKVYEVAKDFRNEGLDRQHNPEFTQIEFYWAYADYHNLMDLSEDMLSRAVKKVTGSYQITYQGKKINFKPPWERITYKEIILKDFELDIDKITTEKDLLEEIKARKIKLDLKDITGYANILDELYKVYSRPKIKGPVFLIDHPYEAKPLAKRKPDEPDKVASVTLLIGGFEIFNAYSELNDPIDQKKRWQEEKELAKAGFKEAQMMDIDYIKALEYGMPPTAGWGLGLDRFTAIITNQPSLKDTIIFPTLKPKK